jgi:carbonic anhydrase
VAKRLPELFEGNRAWARAKREASPQFFQKLSQQQAPKFLWIGCADSRVPATEICGLEPGEMFVHRNVANVVVHTDLNCLSVTQYAVEVLKVTDIIVCGHYGCGGVQAAVDGKRHGLIDGWLLNINDVYEHHREELEAVDDSERMDRLCELNVVAQVRNLCVTNIVKDAWGRGQELAVHGWVYSLSDGLLKDLGVCVSGPEGVPGI